jgi:hypothetical protein
MSRNDLSEYRYRDAINGFFEIPTSNARTILPAGFQPVEKHHGTSILGVTAFEFRESEVGTYRELALSVLVAPRVVHGEPMPRAAMYPFMVGTTTAASRAHGIERWHLPHYDGDLDVQFEREPRRIVVTAAAGGKRILRLTLVDPEAEPWHPVVHHYQTFMHDEAGSYLSNLVMAGPFIESEEERGSLQWEPHPFTRAIELREVGTIPFREQWMKDGIESIHPLQHLTATVGR